MRRFRIFNTFEMLAIAAVLVTGLTAGCSSGGGTSENNNGNTNTALGSNLSNTDTDSTNPLITADSEGNVYVVWEETVSGPEHKELYMTKSGNSGADFADGKSLTDLRGANCSNTIAADVTSSDAAIAQRWDSPLYLAWTYSWYTSGQATGVKFFREDDEFCESPSEITRNAGSPFVGISGESSIHMVWTEDVEGHKDVFYRRSADKGNTFLPVDSPRQISNTLSDSSDPLLGFDGSLNVNVAWVEGAEGNRDIKFVRSTDGGESFFPYYPWNISNTGLDSHCPVMATYGENNIYITYKGDSSIYFTKWLPDTFSFSEPEVISPGSSSPSCPEMGVGTNGMIYVVWSNNGKIWVTVSGDGNKFFPYPKNISGSAGTSSSPRIAIDESYINIVWVKEDTGKGDIFISSSKDNGKNFSTPKNVSNSTMPSATPVIAADGEKYVYIAWAEGEVGGREIYYIRDEGARGLSSAGESSLAKFLDVSGDGKSDIVIAAPQADNTGKVYLFYSDLLQGSLNGSDNVTSSAGKTFTGISSGDRFGNSVAIAGDINGDGYADIIVGAPYADNGGADSGAVYVYFGGPQDMMDTDADITIEGASGSDNFGFSVSPAGDVNHDGFDDILIGAPNRYQSGTPYAGEAYIFYGGPSLGSKAGYPTLSSSDADVVLKGENTQDKFGYTVSWAGDFNKDGNDDVLMSAPWADNGGNTRGRAYIYYGGSLMDSKADVTISGAADLDQLGISLARAGDVNGDGYGDVLIGAPLADVSIIGDNMGKAYIIYGGDQIEKDIDLSGISALITILNGSKEQERFGTSAGYGGDINNDGYSDIVIGNQYLGMDSTYTGRGYVYLGGPSLDNTPDVILTGDDQSDRFGAAVGGAGDVNGDNYYDVLIGAYLADADTANDNAGKTYLYKGGEPLPDSKTDAVFSGEIVDGWSGFSLYRQSKLPTFDTFLHSH